MKITDMIRYYSFRIVEIANDKIGQMMIASFFAFIVILLSYFDPVRKTDTIRFIQIILTLMSAYSQILIHFYLNLIMVLEVKDRLRVFNSIKFANVSILLFSLIVSYSIYSTWYGVALRVILAIFILSSILLKSNSMYLSEKK